MKHVSKKAISVLMVALFVLGLAGVAIADSVSMSGKIIQSEDQFMLDTGEKQITLSGDLEGDMVGQDVNITGTMGTDASGVEVLTIESIELQ